MKVTQLQLNDWISIKNGFPMQVVGLYKDVAYLDFEGNEGDMWEEEEKDLYPIPITPEILEKNGFEKKEYSFQITVEGFKDIRIDESEGGEWWWIDVRFGRVRTNIRYVHELQHALRLCETNKEIEL